MLGGGPPALRSLGREAYRASSGRALAGCRWEAVAPRAGVREVLPGRGAACGAAGAGARRSAASGAQRRRGGWCGCAEVQMGGKMSKPIVLKHRRHCAQHSEVGVNGHLRLIKLQRPHHYCFRERAPDHVRPGTNFMEACRRAAARVRGGRAGVSVRATPAGPWRAARARMDAALRQPRETLVHRHRDVTRKL
jgi:hypothetical protein